MFYNQEKFISLQTLNNSLLHTDTIGPNIEASVD